MNFKSMLANMDDALFNEFSEAAIYNKKSRVSVVIDKDAEQFGGFDTRGAARRNEVTFLNAEVTNPKRGHTLETDEGIFSFDGQISNDGHVSKWHINES